LRYRNLIIILILAAGFQQDLFSRDNPNKMKKHIALDNEKELEVNISFGAGKLIIRPAQKGTLFKGVFKFNKWEPSVKYSVFNDVGKLRLNMPDMDKNKDDEDTHIEISDWDDLKQNTWELAFSPEIPISFNIDMGASENDFDFGSMKIENLKIQTGASDMVLNFSKPNAVKMKSFTIEAGVSKIVGKNLMNANFKEFTFNGGVGDYEFFMDGSLYYDARLDIDSGVSSTILMIDPKMGFKAEIDKSFLSSVRIDGEEDEDDIYFSHNYSRSRKTLDIFAETGVGYLKILVGD